MDAKIRVLVAAAGAVLVAGCTAVNPGEAARRRGYAYVMETGSHLPKKVPLGERSDGGQNIEKVDGAAFSR
ncbi:MAG TPA: hypothetical protein VEB66_13520, partial [Opitutaceae bacterium]|nr:hypothetical protein [Opitutaceae bacterium]